MRVENVFSLIFVSIGNAVSPYVSQNLGAGKPQRIKKGYHAALVLDVCFAALAFLVIETLHTQISSLFLGKDGTALAYQVSGDYMRWLGYFFIFMGIKMATDGVLRGLGIMRPFLIANMVKGVSEGFKKELEIVGVGYRAQMKGKKLALTLGFSHPLELDAPAGVTIECPSATQITISGADNEVVGEFAAKVRGYRLPEPYKGKGIRYVGEHVRRKAGKAGTKK